MPLTAGALAPKLSEPPRSTGWEERRLRSLPSFGARHSTAPLGRRARPRSIQQNAPHDLGRHGEKVGAVLPVDVSHVDQAQVGFVNQGCGLEGAAGALVLHAVAGDAAELSVDPRRELVQGGCIPVRPSSMIPAP
jgi:hypothetical protein